MSDVKGVESVVGSLRDLAAKAKGDTDVVVLVGFTASYAIYVHENMQAAHPTGQAKFLEDPLRTGKAQMMQIITTAVRQGKTIGQALLLAGLWLQGEAQKLCPVDTGALRASAFTRFDVAAGQSPEEE